MLCGVKSLTEWKSRGTGLTANRKMTSTIPYSIVLRLSCENKIPNKPMCEHNGRKLIFIWVSNS
jgi:hypothetical protein